MSREMLNHNMHPFDEHNTDQTDIEIDKPKKDELLDHNYKDMIVNGRNSESSVINNLISYSPASLRVKTVSQHNLPPQNTNGNDLDGYVNKDNFGIVQDESHLKTGLALNDIEVIDLDEDVDQVYVVEPLQSISLECDTCALSFGDLDQYRSHCRLTCLTISTQTIKCPVVGCSYVSNVYSSNTAAALIKVCDHVMSKHTGDEKYWCKLCRKGFPSYIGLYMHKKKHSDSTKNQHSLEHDMKEVKKDKSGITASLKEKWITCQEMDWATETPEILQSALKSKTDDIRYKCVACSEVMDSLDGFSKHCLTDCPEKENQILYCPFSGCTYNIDTFLKYRNAQKSVDDICDHIRAKHTRELAHFCSVCGKGFASSKALNYHINRHKNPSFFYCTDCSHFYKQISYTKHMKRHELTNFQCDVCQKVFQSLHSLQAHDKIHTKKFMYPCNSCEKEFHQKGNLQQHIERKHSRRF